MGAKKYMPTQFYEHAVLKHPLNVAVGWRQIRTREASLHQQMLPHQSLSQWRSMSEICDTHSTRFNCTCAKTYSGQRCEKMKHPRSCKDIAKNGTSTSGKYDIYDSSNERFSVYCDLQSEPDFVWTLIQSLSLSKRNAFNYAGFGKNVEIDIEEGEVNWNEFRLSLSQMQYLANHSTHLRATCNFSTDGLQYTDYARAKLAGHDIFGTWNTCKM